MGTRNSSGDDMANVTFLYNDIFNHALSSVPRKLPNSVKYTKNEGHYAVQGHSRSPILVPIESS